MIATVTDPTKWKWLRAKSDGLSALSLVASGTYCLFLTEFLAQLESETGAKARDIFDIIGGTSSGALVAAALNQGVPAARIGEEFSHFAPKIYRKHPFPFKLTGHWIKSPYSQHALRELFVKLVGKDNAERSLYQAEGALLLPNGVLERLPRSGVDTEPLSEAIDLEATQDISLVDAVIASMATPGQFSPIKRKDRLMVDPSFVTSPISDIPRALANTGKDISKLGLLSLRAMPSADATIASRTRHRATGGKELGLAARLKHQKSIVDRLPALKAAQASAFARSQLGERFLEYCCENNDSVFKHNSCKTEHLAIIKKAGRRKFQEFSSGVYGSLFP